MELSDNAMNVDSASMCLAVISWNIQRVNLEKLECSDRGGEIAETLFDICENAKAIGATHVILVVYENQTKVNEVTSMLGSFLASAWKCDESDIESDYVQGLGNGSMCENIIVLATPGTNMTCIADDGTYLKILDEKLQSNLQDVNAAPFASLSVDRKTRNFDMSSDAAALMNAVAWISEEPSFSEQPIDLIGAMRVGYGSKGEQMAERALHSTGLALSQRYRPPIHVLINSAPFMTCAHLPRPNLTELNPEALVAALAYSAQSVGTKWLSGDFNMNGRTLKTHLDPLNIGWYTWESDTGTTVRISGDVGDHQWDCVARLHAAVPEVHCVAVNRETTDHVAVWFIVDV